MLKLFLLAWALVLCTNLIAMIATNYGSGIFGGPGPAYKTG